MRCHKNGSDRDEGWGQPLIIHTYQLNKQPQKHNASAAVLRCTVAESICIIVLRKYPPEGFKSLLNALFSAGNCLISALFFFLSIIIRL